MLKASIIICTCSRLTHLQKTIRTVEDLSIPDDLKAELVVVDNASTDGTLAWLSSLRLSNIDVRVVIEKRRGLGRARNAGIQTSSGDILLFTDDDVRLPADWLVKMCEPIVAGRADVVRGKSTLHPTITRPWMSVFHRAVLAETLGYDDHSREDVVGISMGFARRVLASVAGFDPELGAGTPYGEFEDTLFAMQVRDAGFRIETVLDAPVVHVPDPDRLRRAAFVSAAAKRGRCLTYVAHHWHHQSEEWWTRRSSPAEVWRHPFAIWVHRWMRLALWRCMHPRSLFLKEGIAYGEYARVKQLAQIHQFIKERRRPRKYERRDVQKLHPDDRRAPVKQSSRLVGDSRRDDELSPEPPPAMSLSLSDE